MLTASRYFRPSFHGWRAVSAAFIVAVFGWGTGFYGPPIYLDIVQQLRGWSISLVSGAVTVHFLIGLAVIPNLPKLYRRIGVARTVIVGAVIMAIGVVGWALAEVPWQLYLAAGLSGIGWSALGAVAVNAIVAPWFVVKRPMALGAAFNGGSVGGVIFSPLWVALVERFGFFSATLLVGIAMIAILAWLGMTALSRTPAGMHQAPDGEELDESAQLTKSVETTTLSPEHRSLSRRPAFISLCVGMTLALFAQTGVVAHLVSILAPALGRQGAGLAAGACGVTAVMGRLAVSRRPNGTRNWRAVASWSLCAQAAGCGVLALAHANQAALLVAGVVLFGLGVGNAISVPPVIANLEFSKEDAPRAIALIVGISQGAYAVAPAIFGWLRDYGSNRVTFLVAVSIQVAAIGSYMAIRRKECDSDEFRCGPAGSGAARSR